MSDDEVITPMRWNGAQFKALRTLARHKGLKVHSETQHRLILISTEDDKTYIELGGVAVEMVEGILRAMPDKKEKR